MSLFNEECCTILHPQHTKKSYLVWRNYYWLVSMCSDRGVSHKAHRNKPGGCSNMTSGLKGQYKKRDVCHPQTTWHTGEKQVLPLAWTHKNVIVSVSPFQFSHTSWLSVWNEPSLLPVTSSLEPEVKNGIWSDSEHIKEVNEPQRTRPSVRTGAPFVCSVITQIVAVPW